MNIHIYNLIQYVENLGRFGLVIIFIVFLLLWLKGGEGVWPDLL